MADTLIHYKLCGPFCDVTIIFSNVPHNDDVTERATQLIVYQGGRSGRALEEVKFSLLDSLRDFCFHFDKSTYVGTFLIYEKQP